MTWFWQPLVPTGVTTLTGTGALSVTQPSISASGTYTPPPITGTAALSVPQPSIAASGQLKYAGSAALSVPLPIIAATGNLEYAGSAALTVTTPSIAGTGTVSGVGISGSAALSVPAPSIAATGVFTAPAPAGGTGGPKPARRRFELDVKPTRKTEIPEPKQSPTRRIQEVHAALSLTAPLPVLSVEVAVAELLPVTARLALPRVAVPSMSMRVQVTSLLGLANERVEELEAVLAAVLED